MKGRFPFVACLFGILMSAISLRAQLEDVSMSESLVLDSTSFKPLEAISMEKFIFLNGQYSLRNSAPGLLSTLNMRGGGSSHVSVRWNGMDIRSPLLGQLDYGLLYLNLFDQVSLDSDAEDTSRSGLTGDLNAQSNFSNFSGFKHSFILEQSTLSNTLLIGNASLGREKSTTNIKAFRHFGENDYNYAHPLGGDSTQNNSALDRCGLIINHQYRLNSQKSIEVHAWAQSSDAEIPPTLVQTKSITSQGDRSLRFQGALETKRVRAQVGFSDEENTFLDPYNDIESLNRFGRLNARVLLKPIAFKNWRIGGFSETEHISASTQKNAESPVNSSNRTTTEAHLKIRRTWDKVDFKMDGGSLRFNRDIHSSYKARLTYFTDNSFRLFVQYHRNFRLPSLNELYWSPGGNADLKTETSKTIELGLSKKIKSGKLTATPEIRAYFRVIDNWILWTVLEDQNFWSPQNISESESKGLEFSLPAVYKLSKVKFDLNLNGQLSESIFSKSVSRPEIKRGDPVYYAPQSSFNLGLAASFKDLRIEYDLLQRGQSIGVNLDFYGENYVLEDYFLHSTSVSKSLFIKKEIITFKLIINNIFNQGFETTEYRPNPGRHLMFSIQFKSKK